MSPIRLTSILLVLALVFPWEARAQQGPSVRSADALSPTVRRIWDEAERQRVRGEWDEAARRYRTVYELDSTWQQAILRLGEVLEAADRFDEAEAAYRRLPTDSEALEALGRLLLARDRPEEAAEVFAKFRNREPGQPRYLVLEADALARVEGQAEAARDVFLEYLGRMGATLQSPEHVAVAARITESLRAAERREEDPLDDGITRAFYDRLIAELETAEADRAGPAWEALETLTDRFAVEDEAERLSRAADAPLTEEQRSTLAAARGAWRAGDLDEARTLLEALTREATDSAAAWGALSDLRLAGGDVSGAEWAAIKAEQLDPLDPLHSARLGDLLLDHFGGQADAEAAAAYARALARPDAPEELWYRRGLAERRSGQLESASRSFTRYLEAVQEGARADAARQFVGGAGRERVQPPEPPPHPPLPDGVSEESWKAYWVALVLSRPPRGTDSDLDRALDELAPVRAQSPTWVDALNLEAAIQLRRGDRAEAKALYRRSLEQDPSQGAVLVVLADLLRSEGDASEARALEQEAASLGEPVAHLQLGLRAARDWRLWAARDHLDAYLTWPARDRGSQRDRAAVEAHRLVRRRIQALWAGLGLVGISALLLPLGLRARSRGGEPLQALLARSPAVWPDVARILSAIRHEVLKHHTTVLGSVADELEVGDPELGSWAADRLCGPRGAIARFRSYVEELELLARVHGVRLNLRYRDPAFGPLIEAMNRLGRMEPDLRAGNPRISDDLRELATDLNQTAYRELGALLRRLCLLELDEPLIREVWRGVVAEVNQGGWDLAVSLPDDRVLLRVFRGELDDILTNLLRNALDAARESAGPEGPRVGVRVVSEDDPITGLERVAIRVQDNATRRISTAMIRGRYIGRGLGLAVDLISRNGGSVHVESEPDWEKAVVIRLPRAEAPDLEDDG